MSYKVSIHNKYADGSQLKLQFDTNRALLHEATQDALEEVFTSRLRSGNSTTEIPVFSQINYRPIN